MTWVWPAPRRREIAPDTLHWRKTYTARNVRTKRQPCEYCKHPIGEGLYYCTSGGRRAHARCVEAGRPTTL